jgi:excinuclease ABC subunit C
LPTLPERIECYDISNIQGENATGSMVVLTNGEIDKSQYRKFKIKITGKPNDYAMHQEMMQRRLTHDEWPLPDLFIIDGGRGQVRASFAELEKKGLQIPMYGIAKRMEWLYPPNGEVVKIAKSRLSLRLLQKIRDEAHRFAITYHRKLRQKASGLSD